MYGDAIGGKREQGFELVIPLVLKAEPDCGGLLALPFMDDEPGLGVSTWWYRHGDRTERFQCDGRQFGQGSVVIDDVQFAIGM